MTEKERLEMVTANSTVAAAIRDVISLCRQLERFSKKTSGNMRIRRKYWVKTFWQRDVRIYYKVGRRFRRRFTLAVHFSVYSRQVRAPSRRVIVRLAMFPHDITELEEFDIDNAPLLPEIIEELTHLVEEQTEREQCFRDRVEIYAEELNL